MTAPDPPFRVPDLGAPTGGGQVSPVLVGRNDLLALADRRLAAAVDGHGELLFLAGEAGIGKSRLLREVALRAAASGFAVIGAGASPGDAEIAAGLLGELSVQLRRDPRTEPAGTRIAERLRETGNGDADRQRRLLVADLIEALEGVANSPWPMLISLEDLHWADDLTLEVLGRLGPRAQSLPVLLIGTYRSDELYPRVPMRAWRTRLLNQRHAEEVRLARLGRTDTAAMVEAIASAVLPTAVTGAVYARSDGIPLHVEEFLAAAGAATLPDTGRGGTGTAAGRGPASAGRGARGARDRVARGVGTDRVPGGRSGSGGTGEHPRGAVRGVHVGQTARGGARGRSICAVHRRRGLRPCHALQPRRHDGVGPAVLRARMDEGWRMLEDAIERARGRRFEGQAARGYRMIGSSASVLVEYDRAERWLRAGIEYAERVERFNDRHYMTAHLGHVRWATGDWDGALIEAGHALADGRGGITTRITALHVLGYVAFGRGDFAAATTSLSEAAVLGEDMRELQRLAPAWRGLAEVALRRGEHAVAIDWCEKGFAASAAVRDAAYLFPYVVTGTRAYLAASGATAARDWLDRAAEPVVFRGIPGTLAAVDHAWGLIHLHEGQTGKARDVLERAAAAWAARRRFWEGTEILLDQARCATRSRRPADASAFSSRAKEALAAVGAVVPRLR